MRARRLQSERQIGAGLGALVPVRIPMTPQCRIGDGLRPSVLSLTPDLKGSYERCLRDLAWKT
jgi:hypothetical protein